MKRVSTQMTNNDVQFNMRRQESRVNKANNQLGSQQRIQQLRDDPVAAGHLVRYESYNTRLQTFEKNVQTLTDRYAIMEGYVNQSVQVLQRVRELAVTGANGTYTSDDLSNMATEVNELLQELVQNANVTGPDGVSLFAGTRSKTQAFEVVMGNTAGAGSPVITGVQYTGSIAQNEVEIDENMYMGVNRAGNEIFWAERQQLFTARDATAYQVKTDSEIAVNGVTVKLNASDNVYAVIAKINDSGAPVKASLDPMTKGLNLATTDSRQLWLEDINGATVLSDLGVLKDNTQLPPNNLNSNAKVSGGSLFDTVIALRDAMLKGDSESIGGKVLGGLDSALSNMANQLASIGSRYERAQTSLARLSEQIPKVTTMISREGDLDFTKAITDLKMLEYVQQATMSTAGKMYSNSLLNYMK